MEANINRCRHPNSHACSCDSCHAEAMGVASARNNATYNGYANTLIEWMLSDAWTATPKLPNVRGNVIAKCLRNLRSVPKIVANGAVSGEIPWK